MAAFVWPLLGGVLIGLSATALLLTHGRRAGITRIVAGAFEGPHAGAEWSWRVAFIAGLLSAGAVAVWVRPEAFAITAPTPLGWLLIAGGLAGFGARLGGGCTSGHGVCGLSAFALRSVVATVTFMATGVVATFVFRHLLGAGS